MKEPLLGRYAPAFHVQPHIGHPADAMWQWKQVAEDRAPGE